MDKRDDTQREVLLDVCDEPITSIDALVAHCYRALSAQLWTTCCWPEDGSGWKIGVYTSVTPEDFAKVAARAGREATVTSGGDTPVVALTHGRRKFLAYMDWRVPGQNLYSLVALQVDLTLKQPVSDEAISRVDSAMPFVNVWLERGDYVAFHETRLLQCRLRPPG